MKPAEQTDFRLLFALKKEIVIWKNQTSIFLLNETKPEITLNKGSQSYCRAFLVFCFV